jgi:uncharacterized protein
VIRGFVTGMIWGGVVATSGLAVLSQVAHPPAPRAEVPAPANSDAPPILQPTAEPAPASPDTVAAPAAPETTAPQLSDVPAAADADAPDQPSAMGDAAPVVLAPAPADMAQPSEPSPDMAPAASPAPAEPPALPLVTAPEAASPVAPDPAIAVPAQPADLAPDQPQSQTPAQPGAESAPAPADLPPPDAGDDLLLPPDAPRAEPAPVDIVPDVPLAPSQPEAPAKPVLITPNAGLQTVVPGVTINRLPRIGDAPDAGEVASAAPADVPATPLALYARAFDNPAEKPLFALVLVDTGEADLDRVGFATLPFAVSFVVDPLAPGAADAAAIYRAAGQEVIMLASGLPDGAQPADVEQTFQALDRAVPQAVAVIDRAAGGFGDDRLLASQVVPVIGAQGRGLLTYDRGLNAADQVARRDGVPAATIFRRLDADGESIPTIRRYLDRAAFRAAQEGQVVVIGSTRRDTLAAIMQWAVEGRAASVALAPVSATLKQP